MATVCVSVGNGCPVPGVEQTPVEWGAVQHDLCHPVGPVQRQEGAYGILGLGLCGADLEIYPTGQQTPPGEQAWLGPTLGLLVSPCVIPGWEDQHLTIHPGPAVCLT